MEEFLKPETYFSSVNGMRKITKIKSQKLHVDRMNQQQVYI